MKDRLEHLLSTIVADDTLHVRWVNTLSYLENCGARKIAACEHPTRVREEMLKHAAEEFRHAHYLKSQLARIATHPPEDYRLNDLLGGFASWHLLRRLEAQICRYLTHHQLSTSAYAYVLVTFAVERQAEQLYHTYDAVLRRTKSKITVCIATIFLDTNLRYSAGPVPLTERCSFLHPGARSLPLDQRMKKFPILVQSGLPEESSRAPSLHEGTRRNYFLPT